MNDKGTKDTIINITNTCPYCLGSGEIRAMQSMAVINAPSIRGKDKKGICGKCNGRGRI